MFQDRRQISGTLYLKFDVKQFYKHTFYYGQYCTYGTKILLSKVVMISIS